jgi:hypothetical protein
VKRVCCVYSPEKKRLAWKGTWGVIKRSVILSDAMWVLIENSRGITQVTVIHKSSCYSATVTVPGLGVTWWCRM